MISHNALMVLLLMSNRPCNICQQIFNNHRVLTQADFNALPGCVCRGGCFIVQGLINAVVFRSLHGNGGVSSEDTALGWHRLIKLWQEGLGKVLAEDVGCVVSPCVRSTTARSRGFLLSFICHFTSHFIIFHVAFHFMLYPVSCFITFHISFQFSPVKIHSQCLETKHCCLSLPPLPLSISYLVIVVLISHAYSC